MAIEPPFRPGDVVRTRYYPSEVTTDRVVVSCHEANCVTGWQVAVAKPDRCDCCHRPYGEFPVLDSSWFWLQRRNDDGN